MSGATERKRLERDLIRGRTTMLPLKVNVNRQQRVSLENQVNSEETEEGCMLMGTGGEP